MISWRPWDATMRCRIYCTSALKKRGVWLGENPDQGPVARVMRWAQQQSDAQLKLVHIRDWHDAADPAQQQHLQQFGAHCIKGTRGARFAFPDANAPLKAATIIDSPGSADRCIRNRRNTQLARWRGYTQCVRLLRNYARHSAASARQLLVVRACAWRSERCEYHSRFASQYVTICFYCILS